MRKVITGPQLVAKECLRDFGRKLEEFDDRLICYDYCARMTSSAYLYCFYAETPERLAELRKYGDRCMIMFVPHLLIRVSDHQTGAGWRRPGANHVEIFTFDREELQQKLDELYLQLQQLTGR